MNIVYNSEIVNNENNKTTKKQKKSTHKNEIWTIHVSDMK